MKRGLVEWPRRRRRRRRSDSEWKSAKWWSTSQILRFHGHSVVQRLFHWILISCHFCEITDLWPICLIQIWQKQFKSSRPPMFLINLMEIPSKMKRILVKIPIQSILLTTRLATARPFHFYLGDMYCMTIFFLNYLLWERA